mgnify:CR=1 FL=1
MSGIYKLTIPKLGLTMEEGTVVAWLIEEGTQVAAGDEVAEVETDKITNVVESAQSGVLRRKVAKEGDVLPVGALIGVVADPSVTDAEIDNFVAVERSAATRAETTEDTQRPTATPSNETLSAIMEGDKVEPLSHFRTVIAKTVSTAWSTIPHIFVTVKIDMSNADGLYRAVKNAGVKISINDVVIKAVSSVAPKFPLVNASLAEQSLVLHQNVNVSIVVALEEGVIMPVIKGCQFLSMQQIGEKSRELVARAYDGQLTQEDLSGGTISISNMGMLGTDKFTAIIPPNQAAILAIGMIENVPVVKHGAIVIGSLMQITMSCDHRILDGAYAARFLGQLKHTLEEPKELFD